MKTYTGISISVAICLTFMLPSKAAADRLTVVASVFPLFDFAREVGGAAADVKQLLPPGVDPHSWEPRPSDIAALSGADIFLYTSDGMEPWAATFARAVKLRETTIVQVADSLGLSAHDQHDPAEGAPAGGHVHGEDPHFWLDLSLAARAVALVGKTMAQSDPGNGALFLANAAAYGARIMDLDEAYMAGLKNCRSRQLITGGHAAFGHLARRYDLEQVSVYGLSPDAEPSPRHLAGIVGLVKENDVRTVFSEALMNPRMTEVLAQETGAGIMVLNPGGNLSPDQELRGITFLDIVEKNLDTLREGLGCE